MAMCSILWLNAWQGMVMGDTPFIATLDDKNGKASWHEYRLTILNASKLVEPGHDNSVIVEDDRRLSPISCSVWSRRATCGPQQLQVS